MGIAMTADRLRLLSPEGRATLIGSLTEAEQEQLRYCWEFWARPQQLTPPGDWMIWLVLAGRGFGKSRTGAEKVRERVERGGCRRVGLIAPTADDARDIMVEGESGILAICPPWDMPKYEPSKRRLTWKNGAIATTYSADEPERLRGKQHDFIWGDEVCAWKYSEAYTQAKLGLRLGRSYGVVPQMMLTTTPRPIPLLKKLLARSDIAITRGSMLANEANLAPEFVAEILQEYGGTRTGRQEIEGIALWDTPGALWAASTIDDSRRHPEGMWPDGLPILPFGVQIYRTVVAVDPAGRIQDMARVAAGLPVMITQDDPGRRKKSGDECGIVVAGLGDDDHGYVLQDASTEGSPETWGNAVVDTYLRWNADVVAVEHNHGGETAQEVILACAKKMGATVNVMRVWASKGKYTRAEPISAMYEQGRIHHVGAFDELEDEMTTFIPGRPSPNRLDAAVFALTELMVASSDPGGVAVGGKRPADTALSGRFL